MTTTDRVEINPRVMLGKPVIRGTRIPVELLLRKLSEGASESELVDAYPRLTREDIQAAIDTRRIPWRTKRSSSYTQHRTIRGANMVRFLADESCDFAVVSRTCAAGPSQHEYDSD